ncbi:MAG: hypothetical protein EKK37_16975 [Sphingobacteriales bacterium]|nr:MAG: hypothetical protein EKK37_16975 [Sphingobacteriales bacterium]
MKNTICVIILFFIFNITKGSDSIPGLNTVYSNQYLYNFSLVRTYLDKKSGKIKKAKGFVKRSHSYIYSKSTFITGIFEDSTFMILDRNLKEIIVGKKKSVGSFLLVPYYDPYEIISFCHTNSSALKKSKNGSKIVYNFSFKKDSSQLYPVISIIISLDADKKISDSFSVEFIYLSMGDKIKDVINYQINTDKTIKRNEHIQDFLENKNGKYLIRPNSKFEGYHIFNFF